MYDSTQSIFLAVVFSILGEIADKTQLVILGFALKYKASFKVFLGALAGHALMDGIAILIGTFAGFSLQTEWLKYIIGASFIILGIYGFYKLYKKSGKSEKTIFGLGYVKRIHKNNLNQKKKIMHPSPFLTTFLTILVTEIGDKTQLSSGLLAAEYKLPLPIFLGVTIGLAITIGLNVFIGSKLAEHLPKKVIKIATNTPFILVGLFSLLF